MRRIVALAGVDFDQWWALTRTLTRIDFRPPGSLTHQQQSMRVAGGLAFMALIFVLFGVPPAVFVWLNPDVLLTGSVTIGYLMLMVVTTVMAQHSATITSTADYAILGVRPVSSRTFFAVRLTNVLVHTALPTAFMSIPPVIAFTIAHGVSPARGLGAFAAIAGGWLATTFALIALYGVIVAFIGAERLQRVLSYAQLIVGMLCYGGIFLMMEAATLSIVTKAGLPREIWLLAVPPAWFASYIEIVTGTASRLSWALAGISVVFLVGIVEVLRGRLSLTYAEKLAASGTIARATTGRAVATRAGWLFRRDEARAIALLVRAQFRHDLKFRLGVLSIVPLTILYVVMGLREGRIGDPFVPGGGRGLGLLMMSVLMFPSLLAQHLASSDMYKAAWIYFATPASRSELIIAAKNVVAALFLGPYVLLLAAIFTWAYGHPVHALAHAAILAMVGHVVLQIFVLIRPRLPFALPVQKGQASQGMFGVMMVTSIVGVVSLVFIHVFVFRSWWLVALTASALAGASILLNRPIRRRAEAEDVLTAAE